MLGVESDARMARAATALLTQDGYHVLFVSTTQQALDILKNETPNVIIAEAEGGEVSGHDLCAIVKTSERLQHVPVILIECVFWSNAPFQPNLTVGTFGPLTSLPLAAPTMLLL